MLLDANVIYSIRLCDLLLRIADAGLYQPRWSDVILDEAMRNLLARVPVERHERIRRRFAAMAEAFSDASVGRFNRYLPVVPGAIDAGDRHVVAAALAGRANVIVTSNVRHFPEEALIHLDLAVRTPDAFLVHQWWMAREEIARVLRQWSDDLTNPPLAVDQLLEALSPEVPSFVAVVRDAGVL